MNPSTQSKGTGTGRTTVVGPEGGGDGVDRRIAGRPRRRTGRARTRPATGRSSASGSKVRTTTGPEVTRRISARPASGSGHWWTVTMAIERVNAAVGEGEGAGHRPDERDRGRPAAGRPSPRRAPPRPPASVRLVGAGTGPDVEHGRAPSPERWWTMAAMRGSVRRRPAYPVPYAGVVDVAGRRGHQPQRARGGPRPCFLGARCRRGPSAGRRAGRRPPPGASRSGGPPRGRPTPTTEARCGPRTGHRCGRRPRRRSSRRGSGRQRRIPMGHSCARGYRLSGRHRGRVRGRSADGTGRLR